MNKVYSPTTLAEAWGCSAQHIRNLIRRGELEAIRFGPKLYRITEQAVGEFTCRNTASSNTAKNGPSPSRTKADSAFAARLARMT
ncbi:helix-turn-helix domain-containing protein [Xanthobacter autotrophicus]|uniref:helix-turn-helix domain-containing protein n=1 Tax=Xanthobacter autotrophicus TaxID=280 RepID=UPI00372D0769